MTTTKPPEVATTPPTPAPAPTATGLQRWALILLWILGILGILWALIRTMPGSTPAPQKPPMVRPEIDIEPVTQSADKTHVIGSTPANIGDYQQGQITINNGSNNPSHQIHNTKPDDSSGGPSNGVSSITKIVEIVPGKYAITTPTRVAMGSSGSVELRLTLNNSQFNTINNRVTISGSTKTGDADFTHDVTAHLESTGFNISPDKPTRQKVLAGTKDTVWMWVISPKQKGKQQLLLSITSTLSDGSTISPTVHEVEVISGPDETSSATLDFLRTNWKELLTLVFLPLGGLAWRHIIKQRNNNVLGLTQAEIS